MRALDVLLVTDAAPPAMGGGAERVLWEQATRLARRGHGVRILARAPERMPAYRVEPALAITHFAVDRGSVARFVRTAVLGARAAGEHAVRERRPHALHVHQPLAGYGVLGAAAARGLPALYTFHSAAPSEYRSRRGMTGLHRRGLAGTAMLAALWLLEWSCLRRAARVHVLSDFSASQLRALYGIGGARVVRIGGGADVERFRPAADRVAARAALGVGPRVALLFTARNLEARMGLDRLLEAMARLRYFHPHAHLVVAGTGSRGDALRAQAAALGLADTVDFVGFVDDARLAAYYAAADAFVLPTRELEGFGLVTVEALASGTPVLGTPIGATPEILGPLDRSLLFRDASAAAIADGLDAFLQRLAADPGLAALRAACRRYAESRYGWDRAVTALEGVLESVAAQRPRLLPRAGEASA
ncbi:MAG TPA: glycosyltransferase family 4 protein [Methylomirabilota bacterium]|jgi:glycosyltransferase involved in cell wall biosynthesis|nr:glycosyltransferase family 4 protein [Methylomirabilota bacterium]